MIVIDVLFFVRYIFLEFGWERIEEFIRGNDFIFLEYVLIEVLNVLWKYYVLYFCIDWEEFERRS